MRNRRFRYLEWIAPESRYSPSNAPLPKRIPNRASARPPYWDIPMGNSPPPTWPVCWNSKMPWSPSMKGENCSRAWMPNDLCSPFSPKSEALRKLSGKWEIRIWESPRSMAIRTWSFPEPLPPSAHFPKFAKRVESGSFSFRYAQPDTRRWLTKYFPIFPRSCADYPQGKERFLIIPRFSAGRRTILKSTTNTGCLI